MHMYIGYTLKNISSYYFHKMTNKFKKIWCNLIIQNQNCLKYLFIKIYILIYILSLFLLTKY